MPISQTALVIGDKALLDAPAFPVRAAKTVRSWDNSTAPKSQEQVRAFCINHDATWESVYDAAHGRRYMLFIYRSREERKACFDYVTGGI